MVSKILLNSKWKSLFKHIKSYSAAWKIFSIASDEKISFNGG